MLEDVIQELLDLQDILYKAFPIYFLLTSPFYFIHILWVT
jgi:hypothetical protein